MEYSILTDRKHEYIAPSFLLDEIIGHLSEIAEKTEVNEEMVPYLLGVLVNLSSIQFFDAKKVKEKHREAKEISPDPDDWPYFALALKENVPVWSNDSRLKKQNRVVVYTTAELLKKL